MTSEEIAKLKVLASSVNPADAYTADDDRSYDVAEVLRNFAPVLGELERVTAENEARRAALVRVHGIAQTLAEGAPHGNGCPLRSGECVCGLDDRTQELLAPELLALMEVTK
jgi:hypothetical protein